MAFDPARTRAGGNPVRGAASADDGRTSRMRFFEGVRTVLGALMLVGVVHHVSVQWSALAGREVWVDRVGPHGSDAWAAAFLVAVLAYVGLSAATFCVAPRIPDGLARLRLLSGAVALAFVALHALHVRLSGVGPHTSVRARYEQLWETMGQLPYLLAYLLGLSGCCLYAALSLEHRSGSIKVFASGRGRLVARVAAGLLAFMGWGILLHLVGHFAMGDGLVPTGRVVEELAPRVGDPLPVGDVSAGDVAN